MAAGGKNTGALARHERLRVFISYSRQDSEFVDWLQRELAMHGIAAAVDREDIEKGEEWWARIQQLITQSDTIVFVLSPGSVTSSVCQHEVNFAESLNKRFLPIVARDLRGLAVPAALARLNYIYFDSGTTVSASGDTGRAMVQLVRALETDISWIREHTRLGAVGQRWERLNRPGDLLLRGSELAAAETWLTTRPKTAPAPTDVHRSLITESRRAATRRQRRAIGLAVGVVTIALGLAGAAYWQRRLAIENLSSARHERNAVLVTQSRFLSDLADQHSPPNGGDTVTAMLLSLAGLPDSDKGPDGLPLVERPPVFETMDSLHRGYFFNRERIVFWGHNRVPETAAYNSQGTRILTVSDDTARLWEADSGRLVASSSPKFGTKAAFSGNGSRAVITASDSTVQLWDAISGQTLLTVGAAGAAAFSPDGSRFLTVLGSARLWEASNGALVATLEGRTAAFSPDGKRIVTTSRNEAWLWDSATGKMLATLGGHTNDVSLAAFGPDGTRIVTVSRTVMRLWDGTSGRLLATLSQSYVSKAAFSSDSTLVVTEGTGSPQLWEASNGRLVGNLEGHAAAFSPDGKRIVTRYANEVRLWDSATGKMLATLGGHTNDVSLAAFSPDGTRIVTASGNAALLWETGSGRLIATLEGRWERGASIIFSPDGTSIVTSGDALRQWETVSGKLLATLEGHTGKVTTLVFSPDGTRIVTASGNAGQLWETGTGKLLATLEGHSGRITRVVFSPDGTSVVTTSEDKTARLWEAQRGTPFATLEGHSEAVEAAGLLSFSPDSARIIIASSNTARLWDVNSDKLLAHLTGHCPTESRTFVVVEILKRLAPECRIEVAAFSSDGKRIITASNDGIARLWESASGKLLTHFAHKQRIAVAAFSPDSTRIVTVSDNIAHLWESVAGKLLATLKWDWKEAYTLEKDRERVSIAAFSPDSTRIVTAATDKTARLWETGGGKLLATLEGHSGVSIAAFSPDSTRIVTGGRDKTARLWEASGGKLLATLEGHREEVSIAAFSPDSTRIVTAARNEAVVIAARDKTARLWETASGKLLATLEGHRERVSIAAFSPDNSRFVTVSRDSARLWNASDGGLVAELEGRTAVFSPDGKRIITTSASEAWLWESASGKMLATLAGHTNYVSHAAFSPDSNRVVTVSNDGPRLWDAETGKPLAIFKGQSGTIYLAAFSPDSTRVVTVSRDRTARMWRLFPPTPSPTQHAKRIVPRCLTQDQLTRFFLPPEPPRWCITGVGFEAERDPTKWQPKWPYHTKAWADWLKARDKSLTVSTRSPPLPKE